MDSQVQYEINNFRRAEMAKRFVCDRCGDMAIEGQNDDELVQKVQQHAQEEHNESAGREQILERSQTT